MGTSLKAAAIYAALVFAAGFALGTLRVFAVEPAFGPLAATLIELPVILTISWFTCRWVIRRCNVGSSAGSRVAMGVIAFVLLISADTSLGLAMGRSFAGQLATYREVSAQLGLIGQMAFGAFPFLQKFVRAA